MKIETEHRDDHQVRIIAEFEPEQLEKFRAQAARKISKEAKIPGFRPGKAPLAVIRRMFGDAAIQEQAVELMVDEVYPEILKEANITPSFAGTLDEIISVDPPKFAFLVPLAPEVDLGSYRDIRKEFIPVEVNDGEVDEFIQRMRTSTVTPEEVDRPAQQGDLVSMEVTGTLTEPDENGEAEFIRKTPYQVVIEDATLSPDNWPYPGFSHELIGLSAADEKDIPYTYPEDSDIEKVRGKSIVFHVKVENVKRVELPAVDDEFAKRMGGYDTVEVFRDAVRDIITSNKGREYQDQYNSELVDQIVEQASIKFPPQMLDEEIHQVLHNVEDNLARQRLDLETYLKMMQMDKDAFIEKEARPTAEKRLKRALVLDEITRAEDIQLREQDVQRAFSQVYYELQRDGELEELQRRLNQKQLVDVVAREAASRAINQRLFRRLKAIATDQEDIEPEEDLEELDADIEADLTGEENQPADETPEETLEAQDAEETQPEAAAETAADNEGENKAESSEA